MANTLQNDVIPKKINAYIIENEIGKGVFGSVHIATNQYTDEKVAIKIFSKNILQKNITELALVNAG